VPTSVIAVKSRRPLRRWSRWGGLLVVGAALMLAGCNAYPTYGANRGATKQGQDIFKLYSGMMTTGIIVGGAVGLLILYTILRYRKRSDEMPRQFHENVVVEVLYTAIPIIIVFVLFAFTVVTENSVGALQPKDATFTSTGKPIVRVKITAFQWGWQFSYPNLNVSVAGETTHGPGNHGPQMVLPVGETVQVLLRSNDVIHGFYVHDFNFSRYALPGVDNYFDLDVLRAGTYNGQCTQICGLYHSEMLFTVKAVSPSNFTQWIHTEVATGHTYTSAGTPAQDIPPPYTHVTNGSGYTTPASAKGDR
jgi:cytochrome c oxidase subunit II